MPNDTSKIEPHLEIYVNKSILVTNPKKYTIFEEGDQTEDAKRRFAEIKKSLQDGFLDEIINECRDPEVKISLSEEETNLTSNLVSGITSEVGRALVGLSILQLCVKSVTPTQSIRLHKGGHGDFSWKEGISMRSLDRELLAPTLRKHRLILYNKDGVMMTRSLAENYPYSKFYKAALRGPKVAWLNLVEILEEQPSHSINLLKKIITLLVNRSIAFEALTSKTLADLDKFLGRKPRSEEIKKLIWKHATDSQYPARLFEISIHSLFQAMAEMNLIKYNLRPLSQMRSANKKAGNIGDIELLDQDKIIIAWDAKYGKSYLFDELSELESKLSTHTRIKKVGFIVSSKADMRKEIKEKMEQIREDYNVDIDIVEFDTFVETIFKENKEKSNELSLRWLKAYTESLCLKRLEIAPIEEPAEEWVKSLDSLFS